MERHQLLFRSRGERLYLLVCFSLGFSKRFSIFGTRGDASSGSFNSPLLASTNAILYFSALGKGQMHRDDFWFVHAQSHIKYQFSFGGPQRRPIKKKKQF